MAFGSGDGGIKTDLMYILEAKAIGLLTGNMVALRGRLESSLTSDFYWDLTLWRVTSLATFASLGKSTSASFICLEMCDILSSSSPL